MTDLDQQINDAFPGVVVRKDLVKLVKGNAIVPSYVLEYLLGQYCATSDEASIQSGVETVKQILARHYVHRNEAGLIQSRIRERGRYKVIDKVSVALNVKRDVYEATFSNLGISQVLVNVDTVNSHPKMLVTGVWCIVDVEYLYTDDRNVSPFIIDTIKPIQLSRFDMDAYLVARQQFTTDEWIDLLLQSIGFNPAFFNKREKLNQLIRLVPFCERNYNLIELGPKGTGKSHIYSEFSPHGILISGGEVTVAKLFVNNATGRIGLVGFWDTVAFDEFAGKKKRADKALVDILKNYMANKSFSRGIETLGAEASMVFVGNTQHTVPYMLKHADLFDPLPEQYHDSAFLDRIHFYVPGWEVDVIRGEMFSDGYGFVVDYLAEILRSLRNHDYSHLYREHFALVEEISTRDRTAIDKTFSGLAKVLFPHGEATAKEIEEILAYAIEGRKRVKDQLLRIDATYPEVRFDYVDRHGELVSVTTQEEEQYGKSYSKRPLGQMTVSAEVVDSAPSEAPAATPAPAVSIADLLAGHESNNVEFKSTLQWDVKKDEKADYLRLATLKTIAAFLNSDGGYLLIGVEDNGAIYGLEQDLKLMTGKTLQQRRDKFELHLTNLIADRIGNYFTKFVTVQFELVDDRLVCLVSVQPASEAAYVDGQKFFMRAGNQTRELSIPDAVRYVGDRW